ncbi:MAG: sodium-dependent transporter [Lentisphaeria bacterium]|nr:sodium-dependent transporter [Lentisphaeria bacterium]
MSSHEGFSSRLGFILAAAGSAVGLGNIWRFPYLTAKYGGGIFLLTYLILVLTFGYALMLSENCLGRMTGKGPVGAFRELCAGKRSFLGFIRIGGWINALVPMIVLPYYCVIGGWVTKYTVAMCCNSRETFSANAPAGSTSGDYFVSFISSTWEPIFYFLLFIAIVVAIVALGVRKGVERFSKILMPLLLVMILAICVYCLCLPGSGPGFRYYLMPDWSKFGVMTVVAAMGQLFYSLSIAMGIMVTYGSYMRKEDNLLANVNHVELFDTSVSFLAGLMIIPAVVLFGGEKAAEAAGPGLLFITMPQVFASLPAGKMVGILFFALVLFAAATSAISLLETNVHTLQQETNISRRKSLVICLSESLGVGIITILGYSVFSHVKPLGFLSICKNMDILDSLDFLSNNIMMPIAAIFTTMLVVAVVGLERFSAEIKGNQPWCREFLYQACMSVIVIPCLLIILMNSIGFWG